MKLLRILSWIKLLLLRLSKVLTSHSQVMSRRMKLILKRWTIKKTNRSRIWWARWRSKTRDNVKWLRRKRRSSESSLKVAVLRMRDRDLWMLLSRSKRIKIRCLQRKPKTKMLSLRMPLLRDVLASKPNKRRSPRENRMKFLMTSRRTLATKLMRTLMKVKLLNLFSKSRVDSIKKSRYKLLKTSWRIRLNKKWLIWWTLCSRKDPVLCVSNCLSLWPRSRLSLILLTKSSSLRELYTSKD